MVLITSTQSVIRVDKCCVLLYFFLKGNRRFYKMDSNFIKLDWLQFSYRIDLEEDSYPFMDLQQIQINKFLDSFPELASYFIEKSEKRSKSLPWYDVTLVLDDVFLVSWTNDYLTKCGSVYKNLGINVSVPSHGLDKFFSLFGLGTTPDDVHKLFNILRDRNCKPTRLDFAFDDFVKKYTPHDYANLYSNNRIITHFRSISFKASASTVGGTFYVGSRQNGKLLRIYDKNYESKGLIDSIRYEVELHKVYAQEVFNALCEGPYISFLDLLLSFFHVVEAHNYGIKNRSHVSIDKEWSDYLNSQFNAIFDDSRMPVEVSKIPPQMRNNDVIHWLQSTCSRGISGAYMLYGDSFFRKIYKSTDKVDKRFISAFRIELDILGMSDFYDLCDKDVNLIDDVVSACSVF